MNTIENLSIKTLSPKDLRWNSLALKFSKPELIEHLRKSKLELEDDTEVIRLNTKVELLELIIREAKHKLNFMRLLDANI